MKIERIEVQQVNFTIQKAKEYQENSNSKTKRRNSRFQEISESDITTDESDLFEESEEIEDIEIIDTKSINIELITILDIEKNREELKKAVNK